MAHKDEKEQAEKAASCKSEPAVGQDDLENNVTTELSEVVRRAFDEDWTADPQESQIVDTQLIAHIDPIDDGALESGFLLKGRFEILELVHSGGMGHVYKATDRRRHPDGSGITHVAIKMMRPSVASRPEARFALEREATKAQALSHPNIINIFDFDEHDGQFFLVMEWLDGESVNSFLRRTSGQCLDPEIVWPIIEGAAAALQHAHDNNVVHADINPSNIFITDDQNVKLLDFGVAQFSGATEHPGDGELAWVTQTYSSPEVLSGHKPVYEDDVFSLGCIAYRMLSGRHPFGGSPSAIAKHKGIEVASIPELGDEYWDVLSRALSYERADRPHRVNDFFFRDVHASDADTSASRFEEGVRVPSWASWAVAAALAFVVIGWWLTKYAGEGGSVPDDEPQIQEPMISSAPEESVLSLVEGMLAAAQRALADGKLVSPDQDNARSFFNSLLVLEPGNEDALRGLRMISDRYVQQAHQALNADDPASAHTALTVATETDPENPAVAFVDQLLRAQGNSELADARLAAVAGDPELAAERLARAERFRHIDTAAIESVRRQILRDEVDDVLIENLGVADAHLAAGRLTSPEENNAHALLLDLSRQYGNDARLMASIERLGERLLTRAAFSVAAGRIDEATRWLDAIDELGVLAAEVESARSALADAGKPAAVDVQPAGDPAGDASDSLLPEAIAGAVQGVAGSVEPTPEPSIEEGASGADGELRRKSVQELGMETYVAPQYPARARRRGITGMVDVRFIINADGSIGSLEVVDAERGEIFAASALEAVRQWRFEPRDEAISSRVTLRFDLDD